MSQNIQPPYMDRSNIVSQSMDLIRFPLAVIVMIHHMIESEGITVHGIAYTFNDKPILNWLMCYFDGSFRAPLVPIFFFISGFVFFLNSRFDIKSYTHKLKKRIHTLFIPYIEWNIIAVLCMLFLCLPCFSSFMPALNKVDLDFSISSVLQTFWNAKYGIFSQISGQGELYPLNGPLWYLRDLMITVIFSPILYKFIRIFKLWGIILMGTWWFISSFFSLGHGNMLTTAFLYFSWGGVYEYQQKGFGD